MTEKSEATLRPHSDCRPGAAMVLIHPSSKGGKRGRRANCAPIPSDASCFESRRLLLRKRPGSSQSLASQEDSLDGQGGRGGDGTHALGGAAPEGKPRGGEEGSRICASAAFGKTGRGWRGERGAAAAAAAPRFPSVCLIRRRRVAGTVAGTAATKHHFARGAVSSHLGFLASAAASGFT